MAKRDRSALQRELVNFNNFQDAQIDALTNIANSLSTTLESSISVKDSLKAISDTLNTMSSDMGKFNSSMSSTVSTFQNFNRAGNASAAATTENAKKTTSATRTLINEFLKLGKVVADTANKYSQLSNELITVTGASGASVRETRSEIVHEIVSQLNSETNLFFDPEKSYEKMIQLASSSGVGNLEAIEELTRPMLLASETLNINQNDMTKLLNRWYRRYSYSSSDMEDILDDIRINTANNDASATDVQDAINALAPFIAGYAGNNEGFADSVAGALTSVISRMSDAGYNTGEFMEEVERWLYGEEPTTFLMSVLSNAGLDYLGSKKSLLEGTATEEDIEDLLNQFEEGYIKTAQDLIANSGGILGMTSTSTYGKDPRSLLAIKGASEDELTPEEFEESISNNSSMVDLVDDKFNTVTDRLTNMYKSMTEFFANWQERIGIVAWSDVITLLNLIASSKLIGSLGGGLGGSAGGLGSKVISVLPKGLRTSLTGATTSAGAMAGAATTLGGVAAGGLLAFDGINTLMNADSSADAMFGSAETVFGIGGAGALAFGLSNPVGWAMLAAGGLTYLGKKAYENATELTGNAERVSAEIDDISDSLQKENSNRLSQISELSYNFSQTEGLEEKRQLLLESGLFDQEELQDATESQLQELIDNYKNAAKAMSTVTDEVLKTAERYATEQQEMQQGDFLSQLSGIDASDRMNVLQLLQSDGSIDEKTLTKIQKAMKDDKVTDSEWKDILSGGKNAWFDKNNLHDNAIDTNTMNLISGLLGWGTSYSGTESTYAAAKLYNSLSNATSKSEFNKIVESIAKEELESTIDDMYGSGSIELLRKAKGYRVGSNYIDSDQLAYLHEGEAVIPKKYNPQANQTELEMLRKYYQESANREASESLAYMKEFTETLSDIKNYLKSWREENARRESIKSAESRLSVQSQFVSSYMATT